MIRITRGVAVIAKTNSSMVRCSHFVRVVGQIEGVGIQFEFDGRRYRRHHSRNWRSRVKCGKTVELQVSGQFEDGSLSDSRVTVRNKSGARLAMRISSFRMAATSPWRRGRNRRGNQFCWRGPEPERKVRLPLHSGTSIAPGARMARACAMIIEFGSTIAASLGEVQRVQRLKKRAPQHVFVELHPMWAQNVAEAHAEKRWKLSRTS